MPSLPTALLAAALLAAPVLSATSRYCDNAVATYDASSGEITCTWQTLTAGTFTVPVGVAAVGVQLLGGSGAGYTNIAGGAGGSGAAFVVSYVAQPRSRVLTLCSDLPVFDAGTVYNVYVGQDGQDGGGNVGG